MDSPTGKKWPARPVDLLKQVASLKITVVCLLALVILVIWGTVYQAEFGLYPAQQKFFYSWYFLVLGVIPLPGTALIFCLLFINLVSALFFRIGFRLANLGNLITHTGILFLLVGSFLTFYFSQESSLVLKEGQTGNVSSSTHLWELAIWTGPGDSAERDVYAVDTAGFKPGFAVDFPDLDLAVTVGTFFRNCTPLKAADQTIVDLQEKPVEPEAEDNRAGGIFMIRSAGAGYRAVLFADEIVQAPLTHQGRPVFLCLRNKRFPLPVSLTLKDFKATFYPNSAIPRSFSSRVTLQSPGGDVGRDVVISMNKPLRYRDYTFFQSSYFVDEAGQENTILSVVKNRGRLLPYIASLWIFAGLLMQFLKKLLVSKKRGTTGLVLLLGLFFMSGPLAAQVEDLSAFSRVAIMEQGRIKPLDTFAENILKQFSGQDRFQGQPAIYWLARVLFSPSQGLDDRVFLVTDPEVLDAIGVERRGKARERYSFSQLQGGYAKLYSLALAASKLESRDRSFVENEIIALYNKLYVFQQLAASFDFSREGQQTGQSSFYRDMPLTIIPPHTMDEKNERWLSPHDIPAAGGPEISLLNDMPGTYQRADQPGFDRAVLAFNTLIQKQAGERLRPNAIALEVTYNRVAPFYRDKFFYGFAALCLLLSFVAWKKWFYRLAFLLLCTGFLLHLWGTVVRVIIRQRPPVTNLYETFLFTGLVAVLLGLVLELTGKRHTGLFTGSLAGFIMLLIAGKYALDGDTMGMLVAVLDSNFWLSAHVITIILGYAGIVLSGFIGHVYIIQRLFSPGRTDSLKNTFQGLYAIQAFGLLFTFLGTVLGGIWADQSWGRFWGWDPKENGALVILLWAALLFHARLAGWIRETGFAFGTVIGVMAVALAWFGVNLLGVGLHAYGFTSGVARWLFLFIFIELLFILFTTLALIPDYKKKQP